MVEKQHLSPEKTRTVPTFEISSIRMFPGAGFRRCADLSGYLPGGNLRNNLLYQGDLWAGRGVTGFYYCATGSVALVQTNPLVNVMGAKLRLLIDATVNAALSPGFEQWFCDPLPVSHWGAPATYELAFQGRNSITFGKVAFAAGVGIDKPWELANLYYCFRREVSVPIRVLYDGVPYLDLECTFKVGWMGENSGQIALACPGARVLHGGPPGYRLTK